MYFFMNNTLNINLTRIANMLKPEDKVHQINSIIRLKGLGKNIWRKTDSDICIKEERESWD